MNDTSSRFTIRDKVAVITGAGGALGGAMARALAQAGARVAVINLHRESAERAVAEIIAGGGQAIGIACDVRAHAALERARALIGEAFGQVDILVNAAGGNQPGATTSAELSLFDLEAAAMQDVFSLNFTGTLYSCQVFGRDMAERKQGCIVNIASMNAIRPLTRIPAYSAAKAAVVNFTQWLAVHMAREYSPAIRVNAIAPGFFLTEQNRYLLTDQQSSAMTPRGEAILQHTPMGRLGEPDDLVGTLLWLVSPASAFVTGIVVPVDGGFSIYSGV